jgi:Holliday junction resolvasome RuvABC ATP-dependent DNA helicase subunit
LKTIATILNVDEKVVEKDIEPLLINLWIIEKTTKWRKLLKKLA